MTFNDDLDAGVGAFCLVSGVVILGAAIKEGIAGTSGGKAAASSEAPYVRTQLTGA